MILASVSVVLAISALMNYTLYIQSQKIRKENDLLRGQNLKLANNYTALAARTSFVVDRWEAANARRG